MGFLIEVSEFDAGPHKNLDVSGYIFGHETFTNNHQLASELKKFRIGANTDWALINK